MATSKSFSGMSANLEKRLDVLEKTVAKSSADIVMEMVNNLVLSTPVDTSKALSNWQVSLKNPISSEINAYFEGIRGSTFGSSSQAAIADARNVLNGKTKQGVVYLSNLADYIADLNRGSSKQSAGGFVEAAVALGQNRARKLKIKF